MNVTMSPTLRTGGKLLMLPKFDPKSFIKVLEDHKVITTRYYKIPHTFHLLTPNKNQYPT